VVLGLLALQGVVGGVQWALKLPGELVWVHVALATATWLAMLWTVATAGRLEPRAAAEAAPARPGAESKAPSLSRG
jgi:cytochrome c oxidase assembly protein subunit 15